ncbi:hypothetical protein V496_01395 [Pseudogymnoascus sp. VKM F-4515 (FW-2607)]|nr:hypothetical protein V496_01395 [Pseudogymnoascus sp. VKM F-4515 (FW-2607)]KFY93922.1 hypothetical protein V498_04163 [Pseudogymnoascus sp. VKM F-4517 (FW-2822)]
MLVLSALKAVACPRIASPASKALASRPYAFPSGLNKCANCIKGNYRYFAVDPMHKAALDHKPKKACTSKGKERANDPMYNSLVNGNLAPKDIPLSSIKPAFSVPTSISVGPVVVDIANYASLVKLEVLYYALALNP